MAGAKNPPPKYRKRKDGGWYSRRCGTIAVAICAAIALVFLAAMAASRMGMQMLTLAATDMAIDEMKEGIASFKSFQIENLQALAVFRIKGYADFREVWIDVKEKGRWEHIEAVREKMRSDSLFELVHEGPETSENAGSERYFGMIAPEYFSEKAYFLAFDVDAYESLLRKILVKEENDGFSDMETERLEAMALQTPEKASLFRMQAEMRLEMRRLILSRFSLTLAAEVLEAASNRRREREAAKRDEAAGAAAGRDEL